MNPTNKTIPTAASPTELVPIEALLPVAKRGSLNLFTVNKHLTCQDVETAIREQLNIIESCRKSGAVADLRAGVLFHVYQQIKNLKGGAFIDACKQEFGVSQPTIWRKMRLAVIWAKASGASEDQIYQLTNATDLSSTSADASVQLAFDFIGDQTTTDLYRKYKLIDPAPKGGDMTPRDANGKRLAAPRRTDAEIEKVCFEPAARLWFSDVNRALKNGLDADKKNLGKYWDPLADDQLTHLRDTVTDLLTGLNASIARRAALRNSQTN